MLKTIEMERERVVELVNNVTAWAKARDLDQQAPKDGLVKVGEESGEIVDALVTNDQAAMEDALGDLLVTMINFGNEVGLSMHEVLCAGFVVGNELTDRSQDSSMNDRTYYTLQIVSKVQQISSLLVRNTGEQQTHLAEIECLLREIASNVEQLADDFDLESISCLQAAYDVINKRTGKMINGVFVKDEDLQNGIDNQE